MRFVLALGILVALAAVSTLIKGGEIKNLQNDATEYFFSYFFALIRKGQYPWGRNNNAEVTLPQGSFWKR